MIKRKLKKKEINRREIITRGKSITPNLNFNNKLSKDVTDMRTKAPAKIVLNPFDNINKVYLNKLIVIAFILIFLMPLNYAQAQTEKNQTEITKKDAELSIEKIKQVMKEMQEAGFSIERINDSLKDAAQIYEAQKVLETKKEKVDYSRILAYKQEIIKIKETAFQIKDELFSLEKSLEPLQKKEIDVSEAENMIKQIKQEISDERYEKALEMIEPTRNKIAEIEASATTLKIFYSVTKRTIKDFFKENYKTIIFTVVVVVAIYLVFRKRILKFFIKRKIKGLNLRKDNLKKLLQETQRDYFQYGKIPEGIYNIRTKKFAELTRDIDRQIPLLEEELAMLSRRKFEKNGKKK